MPVPRRGDGAAGKVETGVTAEVAYVDGAAVAGAATHVEHVERTRGPDHLGETTRESLRAAVGEGVELAVLGGPRVKKRGFSRRWAGAHTRPAAISSRIQGMTSSSIDSSGVFASKPSRR